MKNIWLIIFVFAVFSQANPAHALVLDKYGVGYGVLNSGMLTEAVTADGQPSLFGSFTYHFLAFDIRWSGSLYKYGFRVAYTVLPRTTADDAADITQWMFTPQFGVPLGSTQKWTWVSGLGFLGTTSKGNGGSLQLNNGNSVATFYRPTNSVSSLIMNIETGLEYAFDGGFCISGDLLFNGLLGDRRNMSLFLNFKYHWGGNSQVSGYTLDNTGF